MFLGTVRLFERCCLLKFLNLVYKLLMMHESYEFMDLEWINLMSVIDNVLKMITLVNYYGTSLTGLLALP
jgi:hypothetical protein